MWRRGARVVAGGGEVHVERVEKIVINGGIPSPKTTTTSTTRARGSGGGVQQAPPPAGQHGTKVAAVRERDINELAEEFIRRNRAAFQRGITGGDHGGGQMP